MTRNKKWKNGKEAKERKGKKKKKKKPEAMKSRNPTCCSMWVCYSKHFLTCFLPNLGRKHLGLTNLFPFLLLIKHPLKKFSLLFSPFYFYPPYFTFNQTNLSMRRGNYASSLSEEEEGQCGSTQIFRQSSPHLKKRV